MDSSTPRLSGSHALSLSTIAGEPAPTNGACPRFFYVRQGKSNHIPTAIVSICAVYRVVAQALKVKRSQPAAAPTGFAYTRKMTVAADPCRSCQRFGSPYRYFVICVPRNSVKNHILGSFLLLKKGCPPTMSADHESPPRPKLSDARVRSLTEPDWLPDRLCTGPIRPA